MATTPNLSFRYPLGSAPIDFDTHIQNLATDLDSYLSGTIPSISATVIGASNINTTGLTAIGNVTLTSGSIAGTFVAPTPTISNQISTKGYVDTSLTTLNASNLTSGTIPSSVIPFGSGSNQVAAGNHTHTYLPLNGGSLTGVTSHEINGSSTYQSIVGAFHGGSSTTGYMLIELPAASTAYQNAMQHITVKGYKYRPASGTEGTPAFEISIGGYNYSNGSSLSWVNKYASIKGALPAGHNEVRWMHNSNTTNPRWAIGIGTATTVWNYPTVTVSTVIGSSGKLASRVKWDVSVNASPSYTHFGTDKLRPDSVEVHFGTTDPTTATGKYGDIYYNTVTGAWWRFDD